MPLYVVEFVDLPYSSLLCLIYELIGVLERTKIFINKMTVLCRLVVAIALKKKKRLVSWVSNLRKVILEYRLSGKIKRTKRNGGEKLFLDFLFWARKWLPCYAKSKNWLKRLKPICN